MAGVAPNVGCHIWSYATKISSSVYNHSSCVWGRMYGRLLILLEMDSKGWVTKQRRPSISVLDTIAIPSPRVCWILLFNLLWQLALTEQLFEVYYNIIFCLFPWQISGLQYEGNIWHLLHETIEDQGLRMPVTHIWQCQYEPYCTVVKHLSKQFSLIIFILWSTWLTRGLKSTVESGNNGWKTHPENETPPLRTAWLVAPHSLCPGPGSH